MFACSFRFPFLLPFRSVQPFTSAPGGSRRGVLSLALMVALAASLFVACGDPAGTSGNPSQTSEESSLMEGLEEASARCTPSARPVRVAFIQDLVGGSDNPGLRVLPADILGVAEAMGCGGGEIGVDVLDGRDQPFLRLAIEAMPVKPLEPSTEENVIKNRMARDKYEEDLKVWRAQLTEWAAKTQADRETFIASLGPLLAAAPTADAELWPVLLRSNDFFNEPVVGTPAPEMGTPILVLISERERSASKCLDIFQKRTIEPGYINFDPQRGVWLVCTPVGEWKETVDVPSPDKPTAPGPNPLPPVDANVRVVVVKGAPGPGVLDPLPQERFEQPAPALRWVVSQIQAGD